MRRAELLVFVVNSPEFFLSHRLPLAVAAKALGFDVHVVTPAGSCVSEIKDKGLKHHVLPMARGSQNPIKDLVTFFRLLLLFVKLKPDLVHLVTIKPVIYGGIAARIAGVKAIVSAVSGLGTVYVSDGVFSKIRRWLVSFLYKMAFRRDRLAVIFQNNDDRNVLLKVNALRPDQVRLVRGSGVNLSDYLFLPEPVGKPVVVMAARLLKDKGVEEFIGAVKILKRRGLDLEARLIGAPDPDNPTSIDSGVLENWQAEGIVEVMGFRNDIARQYAAANIVCLPSYREGLPKSLVEAAACGRAVVTTDVPGCRDAIEAGKTGLLVPVKDVEALANAIQKLIEDPELRRSMGRAGRQLAEREFTIEKIVQQHLEIYKELLTI